MATDYIILTSDTLSGLTSLVKTKLNAGWDLCGGISQDNTGEYMQAMCKGLI